MYVELEIDALSLMKYAVFESIPRVDDMINLFKIYGLHCDILGTGWCGDPIYMFRVGEGLHKAMLISFVDPDEPTGVLTLRTLVKIFDKDPELLTRYSWYFIPVADPCGAKLNEGWFRDPYNIKLYLLERFEVEVIEWKLPGSCNDYVFNDPTPEALAIKKAVDVVKPDIIVPLHNNNFNGLYFFLSEKAPELIEDLKSIAYRLEVPIHRGEPEAMYLEVYEKGFYREPTLCDEYYNCIRYSAEPMACVEGLGGTIYGYAKNVNPHVFSIVCETPYIYSKVLEDDTPSGAKLRDVYYI